MGTCDGAGGEPGLDTSWRNSTEVRPATTTEPERASCAHPVQSNGTCGNGTCNNYGNP